VALSDTSPEVEALQLAMIRSMSGEQRLLRGLELTLFAQQFAKAGIRQMHPNWSDREIMLEIFRRAFLPEALPPWVR
jgi:hypothetical protein